MDSEHSNIAALIRQEQGGMYAKMIDHLQRASGILVYFIGQAEPEQAETLYAVASDINESRNRLRSVLASHSC